MSLPRLVFNPFNGVFEYVYPDDYHGGYFNIPETLIVVVHEWKTLFALQFIIVEGSLVVDGQVGIIE